MDKYSAKDITVLEGLEAMRKKFDIIEISRSIKRKGDVLKFSQKFKIKPRILNSAFYEGRVLAIYPDLEKSKAGVLALLRTDRELKLFGELYDIYNISVRDLIQFIRKWNNYIQQNPLLLINKEEHEMILGTLMGDSSIRQRNKNSSLRFSHSLKQKDYWEFKKDLLKEFVVSEFSERKRIKNNKIFSEVNFSTKTHPIFNYYRRLFYRDNRKIVSEEILNGLTPRSLAFWICDDGSYCKNHDYIILCTNSFTFNEHKIMRNFFITKFGLKPSIGFRDNKYCYLRFNKQDTEKLKHIIKPFMPACMNYKIGNENGK